MSFWVQKNDRKRRLFWGKIKLEPTVAWKILGSEVLRHDSAGMISCVLSELPTTHKQLVGKREIPMLSICCVNHNNLLTLLIDSKLASLESLYRHKLVPQHLHFEDMLTRLEGVSSHAQRISKTHTKPVLVWNIYMQCSTGLNCIMRHLNPAADLTVAQAKKLCKRWLASSIFALMSQSLYFSTEILCFEKLGEDGVVQPDCLDEKGRESLGTTLNTLSLLPRDPAV